jgi:CubicO group peptidase (beta-lactamase class C family)
MVPADIDAQFHAIAADPAMPLASLSVLAVRDGRVVYEYTHGRRWIDPADPSLDRPANADTLFRVASISKFVTSVGVMRLVDEGTLDLDADVSTYLGFTLRNPHFPSVPITLRMLMSHTSSLRDTGGYSWGATTTLDEVFAREPKMWSADHPPGVFFQYANLPWGVIGTVMERATGERFDRLMRRLVLDPLRIEGGFNPQDFTPAQQQNVATLYRKRPPGDDDNPWSPTGPWLVQTDDFVSQPIPSRGEGYVIGTNGTLFGPQGSCRLTPRGLAKLMLMMMNDGTLDGVRVLKPGTANAMLREAWRINPAGTNGNTGGEFTDQPFHATNSWGLGAQRILDISHGKGKGDRIARHGGWQPTGHYGDAYGLSSGLFFDTQSKTGVIYIVGGVGQDPRTTPGTYSAQAQYEERIMAVLFEVATGRNGP